MVTKIVFKSSLLLASLILFFGSCKKSSSKPDNDNNLSALNGAWQTTVWGGANDTARASISSSSAKGTLTYLGASAIADSKFSVGDVIYSDIKSTGNGTFSCTGTYRYTTTSGTNATVGTTQATLTLQNSNTTLYAHYTKDPASGVTPPDYYWYKNN